MSLFERCVDDRPSTDLSRASPAKPERLFSLLPNPELSVDQLDELVDAAGFVSDATSEAQWRAFKAQLRVDTADEEFTVHPPEDVFWEFWNQLDELKHHIQKRVRDRQTADDLAVDTFYRAINKWHTFDPKKGSRRTWYFKIGYNLTTDWLRRTDKLSLVDTQEFPDFFVHCEDQSDEEPNGPDEEPSGRTKLIADANHLSKAVREVYEAHLKHPKLSHAELADVLGFPPNRVYQYLHRARKTIRSANEHNDVHA